jgi:hypothetical protein
LTLAQTQTDLAPGAPELLSPAARLIWRVFQAAVWLVALVILVLLAFAPEMGLHALWNVLIPVAPALLAVAPGLWRNICPLGTTSQLPRHFGISAAVRLPPRLLSVLQATGIVLLLLIVPLRHVLFNVDAQATLTLLIVIGAMALVSGFVFEGKSGWCAGICPVHPVEKLYGQDPAISIPNAHCRRCVRCTAICPDSTKAMHPLLGKNLAARRWAGALLVGGFPGYIWGWFHIPDAREGPVLATLGPAYVVPFGAMAVSLAIFLILASFSSGAGERRRLVRTFAAAAISIYYWYRLPGLVGHGLNPGDGMLVDLRRSFPAWILLPVQVGVVAFWFWWLLGRHHPERAWQIRPPYAPEITQPKPMSDTRRQATMVEPRSSDPACLC